MARIGHGDDGLRYTMRLRNLADPLDRAENLDADELGAVLARIIVEQSDDAPLRAGGQFLDQGCGRLAGSQHQRRIGLRPDDERRDMTLAPRAVSKAVSAHRD